MKVTGRSLTSRVVPMHQGPENNAHLQHIWLLQTAWRRLERCQERKCHRKCVRNCMTKGQEQGPPIWEFEGMQHHVEWWFKVKMLKKWNSTTSSQTTSWVSARRLVKSLRACQKNLGWVKKLMVLPKNLFSSLLSRICSATNEVFVMFCLFSRGSGGID